MGPGRPAAEAGLSEVSADAVPLCLLAELAEGQARGFDPWQDGKDSLFALRHRGRVRVYRNRCPHLDVPMHYRKDRFLSADGQLIICYAHGAQFRPDTGACIHGPCLGESLVALQCLERDGWLLLPVAQLSVHEVSRLAMVHIRSCD